MRLNLNFLVIALFVYPTISFMCSQKGDSDTSTSQTSVVQTQTPYSPQLCALHGIGCGPLQRTVEEPNAHVNPKLQSTRTVEHNRALMDIDISELTAMAQSLSAAINEETTIMKKAEGLLWNLVKHMDALPFHSLRVILRFCSALCIALCVNLCISLLNTYLHHQGPTGGFDDDEKPAHAAEALILDAFQRYIFVSNRLETFSWALHALPLGAYAYANYLFYFLFIENIGTFTAVSMALSAFSGLKVTSLFVSVQLCLLYVHRMCLSALMLWAPFQRLSFHTFQKRVHESFRLNKMAIGRLFGDLSKAKSAHGRGGLPQLCEKDAKDMARLMHELNG